METLPARRRSSIRSALRMRTLGAEWARKALPAMRRDPTLLAGGRRRGAGVEEVAVEVLGVGFGTRGASGGGSGGGGGCGGCGCCRSCCRTLQQQRPLLLMAAAAASAAEAASVRRRRRRRRRPYRLPASAGRGGGAGCSQCRR